MDIAVQLDTRTYASDVLGEAIEHALIENKRFRHSGNSYLEVIIIRGLHPS